MEWGQKKNSNFQNKRKEKKRKEENYNLTTKELEQPVRD